MNKTELNELKKKLNEKIDFLFSDLKINIDYFIKHIDDDLESDDIEKIVKTFDYSLSKGFLELFKEYINIYR